MKAVRVGVIGAGYWGPNLIRNLREIPEADLRMVCDLRKDRLEHISQRFPEVQTTSDYHQLLESDIEAVVVSTPAATHSCLAMECLRAGKHILVEKPLTTNSAEACQIVETASRLGKVVMTGHTFLFNPAIVALKQIIDSGEIGRIYYINGTRVNLGLYQPDINVVWDLAPHDISILLYLLGQEPISTSARGGMFVKPDVHDVAYLTLNFPHSVLADLRVSWLDPCKIRRITIVGSKKMIVYDDILTENKLLIYDKGVDVQPYTDTYEEFHLAYRYGEVVPYPLPEQEPLKMECQHFLECIRMGITPRSDGIMGLKVVRILETAQRSLLNGGMREDVLWESREIFSASRQT